eukprot:gene27444-33828_t
MKLSPAGDPDTAPVPAASVGGDSDGGLRGTLTKVMTEDGKLVAVVRKGNMAAKVVPVILSYATDTLVTEGKILSTLMETQDGGYLSTHQPSAWQTQLRGVHEVEWVGSRGFESMQAVRDFVAMAGFVVADVPALGDCWLWAVAAELGKGWVKFQYNGMVLCNGKLRENLVLTYDEGNFNWELTPEARKQLSTAYESGTDEGLLLLAASAKRCIQVYRIHPPEDEWKLRMPNAVSYPYEPDTPQTNQFPPFTMQLYGPPRGVTLDSSQPIR